MDALFPVYAWVPAASTLHPLPGLNDQSSTSSRVVLAAGGRYALYARNTIDSDDETIPLTHRVRCYGPYRLDLTTGQVDEATFTPRPERHTRLEFVGSPDGQQVVIAENWQAEPPPGRNLSHLEQRCTLWLASFSTQPARELLTFNGEEGHLGADDLCLHWSPDGTTIAFGAYFPATSATEPLTYRTFLYDAASGDQSGTVEDRTPVGSVAFSPDGTLLLVADRNSIVGIHHLGTGQTEPIPLLPMQRPDSTDRRVPRLLGFADTTRLLIATQRGRTMTTSSTDPAGSDIRSLLRWTGGLDMYPTLAVMPEGFWR
jgi:WD40 repeat protein